MLVSMNESLFVFLPHRVTNYYAFWYCSDNGWKLEVIFGNDNGNDKTSNDKSELHQLHVALCVIE